MSVDGGEASSVCCRVAGGDHFGRHRAGRWCRIHNGLFLLVHMEGWNLLEYQLTSSP
jgi:hypothetical protein